MKKFITGTLLVWFFTSSVVFAYGYPRFWKGDVNYPLVWGHMGTAWYLDKNSIEFELNEPPYYIIKVRTIPISNSNYSPENEKYSNDKDSTRDYFWKFFYDEDEMDMRINDGSKSGWWYLRPLGSNAESGLSMYVGEAVFFVAQGRKFYGNYIWKYVNYKGEDEYLDEFNDDFYKDLK